MRLLKRRHKRDARPERVYDKAAIGPTFADAQADIASFGDPRQALGRRLWHWHMGSWIGPLSQIPSAEENVATPLELIQLAAIQVEAGLLTAAASLVDRALAGDAGAFARLRFPALTAALHTLAPARFARFAPEAEAAAAFRKNYGTFRRLVEENADSICVVGNAPSEIGRGRGPLIDSHALVIRFNNYAPDPKYQPDHGRKTDIWIRGTQYRDVWRRPDERFAHVIVNGSIYWRGINGQDTIVDAAMFGQSIEDVPRRLAFDLTLRLGALPSSGLMLLSWLAWILGSLDKVSIYGFAMSDQAEGLRHYYTDRSVSKFRHAWTAEREIFDALVGPGHPTAAGGVR